jgi:hypothetical protein
MCGRIIQSSSPLHLAIVDGLEVSDRARITGAVNMIRPDGTQSAPEGFTGLAESIPWGLNIDGMIRNKLGREAAFAAVACDARTTTVMTSV